jgi:hypothetical protein
MKPDRFYKKLKSNTVAGVYLEYTGENYQLSLVLLKKKKQGIIIADYREEEHAQTKLPAGIPVYLIVDGKGIVTRKLTGNSTSSAVIGQLFPNINASEIASFCCNQFVTITRNETLDEFVRYAQKLGFAVTNVYAGHAILNEVYPFLESKETELESDAFTYRFEEGKLHEIIRNPEARTNKTYPIDGKNISVRGLIAFGAAIRYWQLNDINDGISTSAILSSRLSFIYNYLIRKIIPIVVIPLFAMLLLNFLLFSNIYNKNQQLKIQLNDYQGSIARYDTLKKEYNLRQQFAKKNNLTGHTRNSFYFDQIAASKPEGIEFLRLENNPATKKSRKGDVPTFQPDALIVQGTVFSGQKLNEWIKNLRNLSWISDVKVSSFQVQENSSLFSFELYIQKKN